jgi:predicted ATP-grasp superfamily ATP-dependent carboligase
MYSSNTRYALIIGLGLNGLGIVRALAEHDVPMIKVDSNARRPGMLSRYGQSHLVESLKNISLIDELQDLLKQLAIPPVLFVTEEAPLKLISENRDRLLPLCEILLPQHEVLEQLMSKEGIDTISARCGFAKPKTVHLQTLADTDTLDDLRFPCILKPGRKSHEYGLRFKKGYKVASLEEVKPLVNEIIPVLPDLVMQEWIEGQDTDIYFTIVFIGKNNELVSSFTGRKLRSWPIPVGGTASCAPADDYHEHLVKLTCDFFKAAEFKGLGGVEFKRDPRDGEFYLIEPTVSRTDFQHEITVINGINMPYVIYKYHTNDEIISQKRTHQHFAWFEPVTERWAREATGIPDKLLYQGTKKINALFRWQDPEPWLFAIKHRMLAKLRVITQKVSG